MKTKFLLLIFVTIGLIKHSYSQTIMNIFQNNGNVTQIPVSSIDSITYTPIGTTGNLATVVTSPVTNIDSITAVCGGEVTDDGGSPVIQYGVCWGLSPNPTIYDSLSVDGSGTGTFVSNLTNLMFNYTYYVRAYAINSDGVSYGNEFSFFVNLAQNIIVSNPGNGVTMDNYTYPTIVLGNGQEWMAENLRTTTYANGDPIPNIQINSQWTSATTGAYSYYLNDLQYQTTYGNVYNYYAVSDIRNVCPSGWHVPFDSDWVTFINYLDPNAGGGMNVTNTYAGGKMKVTGTQYWQNPNVGATNESGFSLLPVGSRNFDGTYTPTGTILYLWSASIYGGTIDTGGSVSTYDLGSGSAAIAGADGGGSDYGEGNVIRCVKD